MKSSIEKQTAKLKQIHEGYCADVRRLTEKMQDIKAQLDEARTREFQTFEAINALEGKTPAKDVVHAAREPLALKARDFIDGSPSHLPPAEPGFLWAQRDNEWVLLPVSPGGAVIDTGQPGIPIPEISEEFEDLSPF